MIFLWKNQSHINKTINQPLKNTQSNHVSDNIHCCGTFIK
jgi:hypothetical protein